MWRCVLALYETSILQLFANCYLSTVTIRSNKEQVTVTPTQYSKGNFSVSGTLDNWNMGPL